MKKRLLILPFVFLFLLPSLSFAGTCGASHCTGTTPWTADSTSYTNVNYCVQNCVDYGETLNIPAGTSSWTSELVVSKYMTISGDGIGSTIINNTGSTITTEKGLIKFYPDATSVAANGLFRVTKIEFTNSAFTSGTSTKGIWFHDDPAAPMSDYYTNIRIDHCKFNYFGYYGGDPADYGPAIQTMYNAGMFYGLIDNCYFYGKAAYEPPNTTYGERFIDFHGENTKSWIEEGLTVASPTPSYPDIAMGDARAWYIEDCYFDTMSRAIGSNHGARYVARFNEFKNLTDEAGGGASFYVENHGNSNYSSGTYLPVYPNSSGVVTYRGTISVEVYQNKVEQQADTLTQWESFRGGIGRSWGNRFTRTSYYALRWWLAEEDQTWIWAPINVSYGGRYYTCKVNHWSSVAKAPAVGGNTWWTDIGTSAPTYYKTWASDSALYLATTGYDPIHHFYSWDNKFSDSVEATPTERLTTALITPNVDYWLYTASFNGTSGVGTGTRAQMDAIDQPGDGICTDGVGFWVTDEGAWNNSSGTDGLHNPNGYTEDGQLYRCASNVWVLYYTPYTYPHPLKGVTPVVTITTPSSDPYEIRYNSPLAIAGTATEAPTQCKWRIGSAPDDSNGTVLTGTTAWSGTAESFVPGLNTLYVGCTNGIWGSDSTVINLVPSHKTEIRIFMEGNFIWWGFEGREGIEWREINLN